MRKWKSSSDTGSVGWNLSVLQVVHSFIFNSGQKCAAHVTRVMSRWSLRPGKKNCFRHADGLQIIVVCWLPKQKHLNQHCGSFLVTYPLVIKNSNHGISFLKILTFITLHERNYQSGLCPPPSSGAAFLELVQYSENRRCSWVKLDFLASLKLTTGKHDSSLY